MQFATVGVHSARYAAVAKDDNGHFLIPVGPNIKQWRINEREITPLQTLNFNNCLVMALERNSKVIVATGYNSHAVVFHPRTFEKLQEVQGVGTKVRISTMSENYYVSCAEICMDAQSQTCINIFKFTEAGLLEPYHTIRSSGHCPLLMEKDRLLFLEINEVFDQPQIEENKENTEKKEKQISQGKVYSYKLCLFDLINKQMIVEQPLVNNVCEIVNYELSCDRSTAAISFLDKTLLLIDSDANIFASMTFGTSGNVTALQFKESSLCFCPQDGKLVKFEPKELKLQGIKFGKLAFGSLEVPTVESILIPNDNTTVRKNSFFLIWLDDEHLLTGDEDGLYVTNVMTGEFVRHKSPITLTACGVTVNDGGMVAVGDFSGTASMFIADPESHQSELIMQCDIGVFNDDSGIGQKYLLLG